MFFMILAIIAKVLLTILKTLFFLFVFLVFVIGLILFVPVRYKAAGRYYENVQIVFILDASYSIFQGGK